MAKYPQEWFEMEDVALKDHSRAVWIPLRTAKRLSSEGNVGFVGYNEEFYGVNSLMVSLSQKENAFQLRWDRLNLIKDHAGYCDEDNYVPCDAFDDPNVNGTYLVLQNSTIPGVSTEWHLHQDVVLTLGLVKYGNEWLRPSDGYEVVARLQYSEKDYAIDLQIRATYLKDYLCARKAGLYITSYRSRTEICHSAAHIQWSQGYAKKEDSTFRWGGHVTEMHNGGFIYGGGMAYVHVSRTDADPNDDVPSMDGPPTDDNTTGFTRHFQHPGEKVYKILGELWKKEWLAPGTSSPIVRGDNDPSNVSFIVDGDGNLELGDNLRERGIWLWFKPDVICSVLSIRGAKLSWSTRDVGTITCCGTSINFGINGEGFINVFADDISYLPAWLQRKWAGFNTSITGKISEELFAAQGLGEFLDTKAPESFLLPAMERIKTYSSRNLGVDIVVEHEAIADIAGRCHRLSSLDNDSFLRLAKDLARLSADAFNKSKIRTLITLDKEGSLKSLEKLLANKIGTEEAYKMMGPLFHIYELRLADAHLPKSEYEEHIKALGLNTEAAWPVKGYILLKNYVDTLWQIGTVIEAWK